MRTHLLACMLVTSLAACNKPDTPAPTARDAGPRALAAPERPPFPNMATAAWGSTVIDQLVAERGPAQGLLSEHLRGALESLHSLEPTAPARLVDHAVAVYQKADGDGDRGMGAALAAVGLVLDPRVEGYRERLTDAHGLAAFAGTFEGATPVAQAARALVAVSAGRVFEGEKLIGVMSTTQRTDADTALLLALARFTLGQRNDELLDQLARALEGKPESARARARLARSYLDMGLASDAIAVVEAAPGSSTPEGAGGESAWLTAILGRARAMNGQAAEGARDLERALPSLPPAEHGEASYWLGVARSLDSPATTASGDVASIASSLAQAPAFAHEAALLRAHIAMGKGEHRAARDEALKVCRARGLAFQTALECHWLVTEACAAAGDAACFDEWAKKAVGSDDDHARLARARAALLRAPASADDGGAPAAASPEAERLLVEAHLLSPFDAELGARVKQPVVDGGASAAQTLRGARRALAFGAPKAAERALKDLAARLPGCRPCRALHALSTRDADEAARRAAAALKGDGPPLAERDLLAVIDVLGGSPVDVAKEALAQLGADPRAEVARAVKQAKAEQQNPEARVQRKAAEAAPKAPGGVPVPGSTAPHERH